MLSGTYKWTEKGEGGDRERPGFLSTKSKNVPLSTRRIAPPRSAASQNNIPCFRESHTNTYREHAFFHMCGTDRAIIFLK